MIGQTQNCGFSGVCTQATKTCLESGIWSDCIRDVAPVLKPVMASIMIVTDKPMKVWPCSNAVRVLVTVKPIRDMIQKAQPTDKNSLACPAPRALKSAMAPTMIVMVKQTTTSSPVCVGQCAETVEARTNGVPNICEPNTTGNRSVRRIDNDYDGQNNEGLGYRVCGKGFVRNRFTLAAASLKPLNRPSRWRACMEQNLLAQSYSYSKAHRLFSMRMVKLLLL